MFLKHATIAKLGLAKLNILFRCGFLTAFAIKTIWIILHIWFLVNTFCTIFYKINGEYGDFRHIIPLITGAKVLIVICVKCVVRWQFFRKKNSKIRFLQQRLVLFKKIASGFEDLRELAAFGVGELGKDKIGVTDAFSEVVVGAAKT